MRHLDYELLLALHVYLMRDVMHEELFGVASEPLLRSALARPIQAEQYEQTDGLRQAAYLFHGLLMSHGFIQGNKRTAYLALEWFLHENHLGSVGATDQQIIDMCVAAINERWDVDQVERWLRANISGDEE
jgi:death-on-curing protein